MPAPEAATAVEVELLEELVPEAVPVALELSEDEPEVAEALAEPELAVDEAVALAEAPLAVDEAVPVESAPVLDAVDEADAVADAEEEEDELESEPSVMLNWFYMAGGYQQIDFLCVGPGGPQGLSKLTD